MIGGVGRACLQCGLQWSLDTSLRHLAVRDGCEAYRVIGPFCPDTDCVERYRTENGAFVGRAVN